MSTPLPGMPVPPPRNPKPQKPGLRATRMKAGRLCERCCREVDQLGVSVAPYPRPARWRVVEGDVVERLCESHKEDRCRQT